MKPGSFFPLAAVCLITLVLPPRLAADLPKEAAEIFKGSWDSFQQSSAARQELDAQNVNTNLLAAAVLHATNHERKKHGLPALKFHPGARKAAALQALIMQQRGSISHDNPERRELRTLQNRIQAAGLEYRFIGENVATAFNIQYESGKPFYPMKKDGQTVVSYTPGGEPIPPHTYASFAQALVQNWMNSPGHRKNILHEKPTHMGASAFPGGEQDGMTKFYAAQVFYTPQE